VLEPLAPLRVYEKSVPANPRKVRGTQHLSQVVDGGGLGAASAPRPQVDRPAGGPEAGGADPIGFWAPGAAGARAGFVEIAGRKVAQVCGGILGRHAAVFQDLEAGPMPGRS